jgi:hypothetical protein
MAEDNTTVSGSDSEENDPTTAYLADSPVSADPTDGFSEPSPTYGTRREKRDIAFDRETRDADDVDPRGLFDDPTVTELRWYYRHVGEISTVVDKPVLDAFKHGFDIENSTSGERLIEPPFETYVPKMKKALIKARRDGFACIFWNVDDRGSVGTPVVSPDGINSLHIFKIEDLANPLGDDHIDTELSGQKAAEKLPAFEAFQLDVTDHGIVVVDDITSPKHGDMIGLYYETNENADDRDGYTFVHEDRLQHFTAREHVDGDTSDEYWGEYEGDSVITPIYNAAKSLAKAQWSLGQTLLRYTAPLHTVSIDESVQPMENDWENHIETINEQLDGVTNKSNMTLPPGHDLTTHSVDGNIDPEPFVNAIVNEICAGAEITKSVLFGSQTGTVSGQETDIKNYYNQVQRTRHNAYESKMHEAARMASRFDKSQIPPFTLDFEINWGPLFKVDDLERAEGLTRIMTAVSNGLSNYVLSVEEARGIIEAEWAKLDADVELSELTEDEKDELDRINQQQLGTRYGAVEEREAEGESETEGNPRVGQNGGGTEPGPSDQSDPS